jgi:tRNA(Ile2) C34 agmatinyltransferase TiaS
VWKWNWKYEKFIRKYDIEELIAFCPKCDCQLTSTSMGGYKCPNCNFKMFTYPKSDVEVNMIIKQRLRKMPTQDQNKG